MQRYFIKLSYNGTAYHGWQIQENTPKTVQQTLNSSLSMILNEPILVTGCGRTDTGVHASQFFAHFDSSQTDLLVNEHKWVFKLNNVLPNDIAVQGIFAVQVNSNSRFDAVSRTYKYLVNRSKNPFYIDKAYYLYGDVDIDRMNEAAETLFEFQDFSCFSKSNTQTATNNCKILEAQWKEENDLLVFTITADRFLRNMVRAIVGTLLEVGKGKTSVNEFKQIIESKSRSNAGLSVPACGLYLHEIKYPLNYFNDRINEK